MQNRTYKKKNRRVKCALAHISPHTIKFITPLLFLLLIEFLWFAVAFYIDIMSDPVKALDFYSGISEHLMMSLLLTVGCAVVFDISVLETDKK